MPTARPAPDLRMWGGEGALLSKGLLNAVCCCVVATAVRLGSHVFEVMVDNNGMWVPVDGTPACIDDQAPKVCPS